MQTILGLDISTSTIGWTIIDKDGNVKMGFIKPKGETFLEKALDAKEKLPKVDPNFPVVVYTEKPNVMFTSGRSTAQTIGTLMRFNGAFLVCVGEKYFSTKFEEIMAVSARKKVIGKGRFPNGTTKEEVFKWVKKDISVPVQWPLIEKGKKKGQYAAEVFDMADSYVIARFGELNERSKYQ